ncbi:MAG: hypothetical protein ACYS9C_19150 [Planctomycetota bacterium]
MTNEKCYHRDALDNSVIITHSGADGECGISRRLIAVNKTLKGLAA